MRATGPSVVVIQHLKSLGIKLRMPKKTVSPDVQRKTSDGGIFGVPLQSLPLSKEGDVPQCVVDICQYLSSHLSTEGLFRKSGSVNRIKTLKVQMESGGSCFASAQPSDAAALLKQFFRELPQPLLTPELQDPLCQIQQSLCEEEKMTATALVTCLLPAVHGETLRYFCTFLQSVASRSDENKMDSGNLAVVLTPSLFSGSGLCEKLTLATEKQLQLQTSAVQSLIENAQEIGQLPSFILEKISLPCDSANEDSVIQNLEGLRRRRRRSMSGIVNEAFNKLRSGLGPSNATPDRGSDELLLPQRSKTKRKASEDSASGEQCTAKKRKSLREVVDENLSSEESYEPSGTHSPLQDDSAGGEVFTNSPSPGNFLELCSGSVPATPESSSRQKARSKRRNSKRAKRMQSGQIPVSPVLLDRKEKVRNSLRIFQRARAAKQSTPESKGLEESGWDMMKRMVTEALEGPIFNSRDFRMAALTLKASNSVNAPGANSSSSHHPPSPSLRSPPSWNALAMDSEDTEVECSRKQRRVLRRSLSMPENIVDCAKPEGDREMAHGNSLSTSTEDGTQDDELNSEKQPLMEVLIKETSHSIHSQGSVTDLNSLQPVQTLRRPNGHTSQYRSVRKLVLSFPWAPGVLDLDPHLKDWEELASHPIKRKGARRFGRSLSQESGLSTNMERHRTNDTDGCSVVNNTTTQPLSGRNRQVFVSRKNITLAHWGHRSLDNGRQVPVEEEPADSECILQQPLLNLDRDSSTFKDVIGGETPQYRGSPKSPIPETSSDPADL